MGLNLFNLEDRDLKIILDNAYALPSSIQMEIKLNLHKMIGDKKFYFSKDNSLARFLINNVPSCELVKNIDAVTLQKEYSILYHVISSQVTDSLYRSNLLNALSSKCYDLQTFGKAIRDIETACCGFEDRLKLVKGVKENEFKFALNVIEIKIHNFEASTSILSGKVRNEYFSLLWNVLKTLTDKLLNSTTNPSIFEQISAVRVLVYKPLSDICYYNATWDRLWYTTYNIYLNFVNSEFAKIINKKTIELWDMDIVDLLGIVSNSDIDEIFDTSKILQTDYISLDTDILKSYQMRNNTLIWSKNITDEDKTEVEKFKNITLNNVESYFPRFIDNCTFNLNDESLAFLKKEFPDIKFIKLIWDGVGKKNIRTVIKYEDSYYILFEDYDNNIFALSQLDSTGSVKLINFSKNDTDTYKVISNFEDFERG